MWDEALRTTMHILNRVYSNLVLSTLFESWMDRNSNLRHLYICGYLVKIKVFSPYEKKLDL